ncbi:methyltransferase family protein [Beggiatoa alba B18LD]|uniref:Methyltransferase family protein n=1 Tax=Beggiatoa alba B18LD TaxID=395493 RepID=I3CHP8_9GAMM|nr:methyltransferase domain-containing protein [Beggiatoa alba]EIJ43141.1 methyltransferase family protein [Beggiatoa alba B18LD]
MRKLFRRFFPTKSHLDFPSSYVPHRRTMEHLPAEGRILVIGDYLLRDYSELRRLGKDAYLLDIVDFPQIEQERFYKQSITQRTPFADGHFACVIMCEVVEHLIQDYQALAEINRILKADGTLILTVPYLNDSADFHVRVHTKHTIFALLQASGFSVLDHKFYGGFFFKNNAVVALLSILTYPLYRERALEKVNQLLYKVNIALGNHDLLKKRSNIYGGMLIAKKTHAPQLEENLAPQLKAFGAVN